MAQLLIIDDDHLIRETLSDIFADSGHVVRVAPDGEVALTLFEDSAADLVIVDILMPKKEGIETIRELRVKSPAVKIIAISGRGRSAKADFLQMAKSLGADQILPKPFTPKQILATADELLDPPR